MVILEPKFQKFQENLSISDLYLYMYIVKPEFIFSFVTFIMIS